LNGADTTSFTALNKPRRLRGFFLLRCDRAEASFLLLRAGNISLVKVLPSHDRER
jgi:hypothetical protein